MIKENSVASNPTFLEGIALINHNKYRKYNQAEVETAIKQAMLNHSWPSDVIPASIKFGVSNVHRCGSRSEYGYTAGDGCVFLYDYRKGGTEPVKINYSELGIESTSMTDEEVEESKRIAEAAEQKRKEALEKAIVKAIAFYNKLDPKLLDTEYTKRKKIRVFNGIRNNGDGLILPFRDILGNLTTVQKILENGDKRWFSGANKQGSFYVVDELELATQGKAYVCEGYATAASVYEATGVCTIMVGDSGNIAEAIKNIRSKYSALEITIAADDDWFSKKHGAAKDKIDKTSSNYSPGDEINAGRKYGLGAAELYGCKVVFPDVRNKFMDKEKTKPLTDFNDVHVMFGLDEVITNLEFVDAKCSGCKGCRHTTATAVSQCQSRVQGVCSGVADVAAYSYYDEETELPVSTSQISIIPTVATLATENQASMNNISQIPTVATLATENQASMNNISHKTKEWIEPLPIQKNELLPVLLFDPDKMLPNPLRGFAKDIAYRSQTPVDLVAMSMVTMFSSLLGSRYRMCPKKLDFGWSEVPNLWCMIVSPPGSMKSHCISEPLKIIKRLATQAREDLKKAKDAFRKEITIYQSNHSSLKKELEKARRKLLLNDDPEEQKSIEDTITNYEKKLDNLVEPRVPFEKRYLTSDATTETLQEILKNNENGLLVERDELISLLLSFEMKGRETDRGFYLSAWNGHSSYNVDRIGRGSIYIPCLCLSIVGGTQPEKIQAYIAKNTSALTNDGLIQRFQLMVYPDFFERKYVDVFPDNQAKNSVYDVAKTISIVFPQ